MKQRVRGIIVKNGEVLLMKRVKLNETYWVFPGGGVENSEALEDALGREILEETGLRVKVGQLVWKRIFSITEHEVEQEEIYFICEEVGGVLGSGDGPEFRDVHYIGTYEPQYISISKIGAMDVRPQEMKGIIRKYG